MYIQFHGEVQAVDLVDYADRFRYVNSELDAERGEIYDQTGMVLAGNKTVYTLYAILDEGYSKNASESLHVENLQETANQLSSVINMDSDQIYNILENGKENDRFQVEFSHAGSALSTEQKDEIESLDLPGIYLTERPQRYYPNDKFASQVIGFTEMKLNEETGEEEEVGTYGVEGMYDEDLRGVNGSVSYKRDKYGYKLLNAEELIQSPEDGNDVYLTIDQKIQTFLEDAMTTVDEQYNPESIMAAVMDPKTGEVLAMSNRPSFDPNTKENIENWYNDVISSPFEPGSTMKIFTLSAAIEEGVYNGSDTYKSGRYRINENFRVIRDHNNGEGWGEITYNEGVQHSSNVAFAKILWEQLGPDQYKDYLESFHFNRATGIDLNGEKVGQLSYTYPMEQITTSFGQGSTFTPIQIMKAATALANEGKMVKPYVTSKIMDPKSKKALYEAETEYVGEPISADTAQQVKDLLESTVTSEEGTARRFQLENFSTFGKTGTAETPDPSGGYHSGRDSYVYSFIGMAPKEDPELMMYVAVEKPDLEGEYGSELTSYIYKTVMENSLHYLEIEPDQSTDQTVEKIDLNSIYGQSTHEVVSRLEEQGMTVTVVGEGEEIDESIPKEGSSAYPNQHILLKTNGTATMPDVTDWTLRDILSLVELVDMELDFIGEGFVTKQNLSVGAEITEDSHLIVELSSDYLEEPAEEQQDQKETEE